MTMQRVLFVGDGGAPDVLKRFLGEGFSVAGHVRSLPFSIGPARRHLGYLHLAWRALRDQPAADCILFWQQFVAVYFLILSWCMPWKRGSRTPLLIYYVIYKPSSNTLINWLKRNVMRLALDAGRVSVVYFMSIADELFPRVAAHRRKLIAEHPFFSKHIEAQLGQARVEQYFFSGGASNRDYAMVRRLAEDFPGKRFKIACMGSQAVVLKPLPPNLAVHADLPTSEFEDMLLRSMAVIIPLENPAVVSGQLVCMAAMQSARPVFMTRNRFVGEWLEMAEAQGFMVFFDGLDDLKMRLVELDPETLCRMGAAARAFYQRSHDEFVVYRRFAEDVRLALACSAP